MNNYENITKNILEMLYKAKQGNVDNATVALLLNNQDVQQVLGAGMVEVVKDLNSKGLINVDIKESLGTIGLFKPKTDYLTSKGEEYYENNFKNDN